MNNYGNSKENSLDLIESCLDNIYKARKAQLMARTRKYNNKLTQQSKKIRSPQATTPQKKYTLNMDEDDDVNDENMMKQLTSKLIAPPVVPADYNANKDASGIDPQLIFEQFYADFEIAASAHQNNTSITEEQVEEICNNLIEKYLSNGLDMVPQTQEVCLIKQSISKMIEEFATVVLSQITGEKKPKTKDLDEFSNQKRQAQKEEAEREKIRKQYESYLKIKKRNDDHPDHSKIKEFENLNSDIKAVIDSIQTIGH